MAKPKKGVNPFAKKDSKAELAKDKKKGIKQSPAEQKKDAKLPPWLKKGKGK